MINLPTTFTAGGTVSCILKLGDWVTIELELGIFSPPVDDIELDVGMTSNTEADELKLVMVVVDDIIEE